MKGIGSESKRGAIVGDTTECGRETKQNERQQQGGSWGHSPEIVSKNGARRVRQRQAVMIAAIVHIINTGQIQSEIHNEDWAQAERKIELSGAAWSSRWRSGRFCCEAQQQ